MLFLKQYRTVFGLYLHVQAGAEIIGAS